MGCGGEGLRHIFERIVSFSVYQKKKCSVPDFVCYEQHVPMVPMVPEGLAWA